MEAGVFHSSLSFIGISSGLDTVEIDHCHSCEVALLKISDENPLLQTRWLPLESLHFGGDSWGLPFREHTKYILCSLLILVKDQLVGCSALC